MATRIVTEMIDDLDGGNADESITFALDGATYEIDLSEDNASALRKAFERYVSHARRSGGRLKASAGAGKATARPAGNSPEYLKRVRQWAADNGHRAPARGRVPAQTLQAYEDAHA